MQVVQHRHVGPAAERPLSRQHFEENDAQREDVGRHAGFFAARLFRRHVCESSHNESLARREQRRVRRIVAIGERLCPFVQARQSEVEHFDQAIRGDREIARLDVPMDDAGRVCLRQRIGGLKCVARGLGDAEAALTKDGVERLARDELHRNEVDALGAADLVDGDDARVIESRSGARFAQKPLPGLHVLQLICGQNLDRGIASEHPVDRSVNLTHAAGAQLADELVPLQRTPGQVRVRQEFPGVRTLYVCRSQGRAWSAWVDVSHLGPLRSDIGLDIGPAMVAEARGFVRWP